MFSVSADLGTSNLSISMTEEYKGFPPESRQEVEEIEGL